MSPHIVPKCIVCGKSTEGLCVINVRHKGRIVKQAFVHGPCYEKDPQWVQRQVKGKNPTFHVFGNIRSK